MDNIRNTNKAKERLLFVDDICGDLGISRETVYKWIDTKKLPAYRLGRLWKFKKEQVDEWVKKSAR